jgi:hypothetical protein
MSSDIEELAREGMSQFTAPMRVSPDLAARTCARHRRRTRHKLTALATGTATVAAGAAVAMTALIPASHPASGHPGTQLTAWTVVKQADGNVHVTIRELNDPSGLQARLRADGVPASVTCNGHKNRSCRGETGGANIMQVFGIRHLVTAGPSSRDYVMVIHPSALPAGIGVQISTYRSAALIVIGLVHASPRCTGS